MPETNGGDVDDTSPRPGLRLELEAIDLDRDGHVLARWQGWVIVLPGLLPGERASLQLQQRQKSRWLSRITERLNSSPERRRPPCILADDCGGCTLQHLDESAQRDWKQHQLLQTMLRIGGIDHLQAAALTDQRGLGYRNRGLIPLRRGEDGRLRMGYFRRGTHRIVNLSRCPVLDPRLDALVEPLKRDLDHSGLNADHDLSQFQGLRHLGLRIGHHTGEVLISLVSSQPLPGLKQLAQQWVERWEQVKGVTLNLQPRRTNQILGPTTKVLAGDPVIREQFCGLALELSTTTFFQINTPQAEAIVACIVSWFNQAKPQGPIVDAYCGIGTISLPLAAQGHRVVGLEINPDSIEQAGRNADANGLGPLTQFKAGDVADLLKESLPGCSALVVDPPRRGLESSVIAVILSDPPPLLAYLSCDMATQARDLKRLLQPEGPYQLDQLQPVDFFPQTTHLENLALLRQISS